MSVYIKMSFSQLKKNDCQLLCGIDFANERLLLCQCDVRANNKQNWTKWPELAWPSPFKHSKYFQNRMSAQPKVDWNYEHSITFRIVWHKDQLVMSITKSELKKIFSSEWKTNWHQFSMRLYCYWSSISAWHCQSSCGSDTLGLRQLCKLLKYCLTVENSHNLLDCYVLSYWMIEISL